MQGISQIACVFRILAALVAVSVTAVAQQGNYTIDVNGTEIQGTLLIDGGVNRVAIGGVVMQGWSWAVIDTDGDGVTDDVRISEPGGGKLDLVDAGDSNVNEGTTHDGNQPYNSGGVPPHPNENGTWKR